MPAAVLVGTGAVLPARRAVGRGSPLSHARAAADALRAGSPHSP
ncbi:hypothetical protein ACFQ2B_34480 [Streptomyces stramineus]